MSGDAPPVLPASVALAVSHLIVGINNAASESEVFALVARHLSNLLRADRASVVLVTNGSAELEVLGLDGAHGAIPMGKRLPIQGTHVGEAITSRRTTTWNPSATSHGLEGPALAAEGLRVVLNAPLLTATAALGCLNVASRDIDAYAPADLELITQLASLIATSLQRLRLLAAAEADVVLQRSYIAKLEGLGEVALLLSAATSEDQVFAITSTAVRRLLCAARVSYAVVTADGRSVQIRDIDGVNPVPESTISIAGTPFTAILESRTPTVHRALRSSPWAVHRRLASAGIAASVSCPMTVAGRVVAVMNVGFESANADDPFIVPLSGAVSRLIGTALERVHAEQLLRHAQKLQSLGVLTGGLAHDFNNLLGAALGHLSIALDDMADDHSLRDDLCNTRSALERCALLTRQMLVYAGKATPQLEQIDVNRSLSEITRLLQPVVHEGIAVRFALCPTQPIVSGDPSQLQQAVMNLITNAADAIGSAPGRITLTTRVETIAVSSPSRWIPGHRLAPGSYVVVECADTGSGIPDELAHQIFDPFFTTKAQGHGLGLATLLGVMRVHDGDVRLSSSKAGTQFSLLFPASEASVPVAVKPRRGLVLLVDDDEAMLRSTKRMLDIMMFDVLIARDGQAAIEAFDVRGGELALVLMDQSMPRMSGSVAAQHIARRSAVPIVLMSGYDRDETLGSAAGVVRCVMTKPFGLAELRRVVEEAV